MKKTIYIILIIFLCLQLSFLMHSSLEAFYIKFTLSQGGVLENTNFFGKLYCVLPWWLSHGLFLLGVIGGYFLGQVWWRIVYIEKKHWKNKKS